MGLKTNGIRVYVFHVNEEEGIDEEYVIRHDMDYVYGMYADRLISAHRAVVRNSIQFSDFSTLTANGLQIPIK